MGMSTGDSGKPGAVQSDINVTPLIDVLLVLLIIFLVIMPVMMKMETLEVPRKIDNTKEMPDPNASMLTVLVKKDLSLVFNDGDKDMPIQAIDLAKDAAPAARGNARWNRESRVRGLRARGPVERRRRDDGYGTQPRRRREPRRDQSRAQGQRRPTEVARAGATPVATTRRPCHGS